MHRLLLAALLVECGVSASPTESPGVPTVVSYDLESRRGDARPLLVFGPTTADPRALEQIELWESAGAGMLERDVDDVRVLGGKVTANGAPVVTASAAELRAKFDVPLDGFAVILLGKDGGEKLRSTDPIAPAEVFARIDAMPMRRAEMRKTPSS